MIVTVDDQHLKNIADAIRAKSETEDSITVDKMAEEIEGIKNNGYTVRSIDNDDGTQTLEITDDFLPTETLPITENGEYDVAKYGKVEVDVQGGETVEKGYLLKNFEDGFATTLEIVGFSSIPAQFARGYGAISDSAFGKICNIVLHNELTEIGESAFRETFSFTNKEKRIVIFPSTLQKINSNAFAGSRFDGSRIEFTGTPIEISTTAFLNTRATDIYVPWSEGEVANAPWGATNATIHYNYTEG